MALKFWRYRPNYFIEGEKRLSSLGSEEFKILHRALCLGRLEHIHGAIVTLYAVGIGTRS